MTDARKAMLPTDIIESTLEDALNLSSDGIIIYEAIRDEAGDIIDYTVKALNDTARELFRRQREIVAGARITELWPGVKEHYVWTEGGRVVATRKAYHGEVERPGPEGTTRWFEITMRPYGDGFACSYRDISSAREALRQAERQQYFYEDLLRQSVSRKAVCTPIYNEAGEIENFRYEYANYGKGIDDSHRHLPMFDVVVKGSLLTEVLPSVKHTRLWDFYCAIAQTGEAMRMEYHYQLDGLDTVLDISGKPMESGSILIAYSDVSPSHKLALALENEKSQLDGVFQNVPLGLTVFEAVRDEAGAVKDLRLLRRNEKALALSRISPEHYVEGGLLSELMPKELSEHLELMYNVVKTGVPAIHELYQPHLNGWILSRMVKHGDGIISSIQDITDIKRYAQDMETQAQLLEGILQSSPHGILVFEAMRDDTGAVVDFRVIRFNEQAVKMTGMPADRLAGTSFINCEPSLPVKLPEFAALIERREPTTYRYYDEQLRMWRRITNTALGDGFVMTMEDITEQQRITKEIEDSARLLNAVLDSSPIAMVVYKAMRDEYNVIHDFQPIVVNRHALEISGFTHEAFLSQTFFERAPDARELRLDALRSVVEQQLQERFEHQVYSTGRWVDSIATPFGDGFIATSKDITALKEQTRIIEEQAMLFEGVLSSLQNGLTILRIIRNEQGELEDLQYLQIADITASEMRLPREAIIGNTMRRIYPGIDQTNYWSAYKAVVDTGSPQHFETHFTMQGYDNYLLNWVTPLGDDKLVSVYYIINDLKRAQKELEHTVHELKRSNDDLEQFASVASHDLQEPLRKLQSFGDMLEQRYADKLDAQGVNLLQRMQGAAGRMRDLVSGLLSFARLSSYSEAEMVPVDLDLLLHSVVSDLDEALAAEGGRIIIDGSLPMVSGIEGQLRHLFHNLLTNAIKFRKAGVSPHIEVTAGPLGDKDRALLSPMAEPGAYVRIAVKDNGIGFEQQYAEKIFSLFERLHGHAAYQGTGIGLSICKRVAERHEGVIAAESRAGVGSTFIVLLRRA